MQSYFQITFHCFCCFHYLFMVSVFSQKELKRFIQLLVTISHCKADDLVSQMYFIILLVDGTPCLKENNSTGKVHFLSDSGYQEPLTIPGNFKNDVQVFKDFHPRGARGKPNLFILINLGFQKGFHVNKLQSVSRDAHADC